MWKTRDCLWRILIVCLLLTVPEKQQRCWHERDKWYLQQMKQKIGHPVHSDGHLAYSDSSAGTFDFVVQNGYCQGPADSLDSPCQYDTLKFQHTYYHLLLHSHYENCRDRDSCSTALAELAVQTTSTRAQATKNSYYGTVSLKSKSLIQQLFPLISVNIELQNISAFDGWLTDFPNHLMNIKNCTVFVHWKNKILFTALLWA